MSDADAIVEVEGVSKSFGAVAAVSELDLRVRPGELFVLLGASGCGKTTLLRLIGGFERPDRGFIRISGTDCTLVPAHARPVNTVFQSYALFPHMTVGANVEFGLKLDGMPATDRRRRVGEMLELVRMAPLARRRPHELSGGQRQRVALARALAKLPRVLLLDEPLAALDPRLREATRLELMAIQRRLGITFVMVTHDQEEAMAMADRIAIMDRGAIAQIGTSQEIYAAPASRFIAAFVGNANLIAGRLSRRDGEWAIVRTEACGALRSPWPAVGIGPDAPCWIAVRPERLGPAPPPGAGANRARGQVAQTVFRGDLWTCHVNLPDGTVLRATAPNRGGACPWPASGSEIELAWDAGAGVVLTR